MRKSTIRNKILLDRGVDLPKLVVKPRPVMVSFPSRLGLTDKQRMIEMTHGLPIELLLTGTLVEVKRRLNHEVSKATISRWRDKLKLNWSTINLPSCDSCRSRSTSCIVDICRILAQAQKPKLIILKAKEMQQTRTDEYFRRVWQDRQVGLI